MTWKKVLLIAMGIVLLYGVYIAVSIASLPSVEELGNRRMNMTIRVKDWNGEYHPFVVGPKNRYWTPSASIPVEMKWAVILAEDSNFYRHEGIDVKAIKNAIRYDLEKKSFARGASTITQQLAKNLFLSREKTITRKIKEIILAKRMEEHLTKGRIMELYLNVVELGPMVYGIGHGARYYFGKHPSALTPRECAFLAAMLPGPRVAYNPYRNLGKVLKRSEMILGLMRKKGILTAEEYHRAMAEAPNIAGLQRKVDESMEKKEETFGNFTGASLPVETPSAPLQEGETPPSSGPVSHPPSETGGGEGDGGDGTPPPSSQEPAR